MKSCIGIFGTSGMAREAGDVAWACGIEPFYVARDEAEVAAWPGAGEVVLEKDVGVYSRYPFVIGIGDNEIRRKVALRFEGQLLFTNLIHPSATFGYGQRKVIDEAQGVIVAAGVRFTSNIGVGNFVLFNQNATVAHDCLVDHFAHVAPGANISGNVHLKEGVWVGAGAVINQGDEKHRLTIGMNSVIGSGAVVTEDCEPNGIYAGVPAKRIK
jgi:sugar O-acyltransferase (sialic acid O-acetyltransferase NeuD family)